MSDTPRTEAIDELTRDDGDREALWQYRALCETLERELNEAKRQLAARSDCKHTRLSLVARTDGRAQCADCGVVL